VKTPAFDRVAREGLLFANAYTPNAKCGPSRSCVLTGRNPWQLGAGCNHWAFFPSEFKAFPEALAERGYRVGMTGKGWGPGVALDSVGKPRQMAGKPFQSRTAPAPTSGVSKNDYAANFADFLATVPRDQPWCFWYGGQEPHRDYEYGSGVAKAGKSLAEIDRVPACWPDNEVVRNDLLDYALEVEHFDRHLGRMLGSLAANGQLENTIVVVTSDNGMPFPRMKGQEYDGSNHLPLAIMWPRGLKLPGRVTLEFVSFIDFAPTFLELAGLNAERAGMASIAGHSLLDLLAAEDRAVGAALRDHVLIGQERHDVGRPHDEGYPIRGIVTADYLYLKNFEPDRWPACNPETGYLNCDGSPTKTEVLKHRSDAAQRARWQACFGKRAGEELYDRKADPDCLEDLSTRADLQSIKERLRKQLFAELTAEQDPRMAGEGAVFERYPYADEKTRGFYERFMAGEKLPANWVNASDFGAPPR
jgi:arylsulfatase A-like enzyme